MKIRKSIFILILVGLLFVCSSKNVDAKEIYFTNNNGVSLTQEEYDFLTEMYWDGYQNTMTQEEYNVFNNGGYFENKIEENIIYDYNENSIMGDTHSTANKTLKITKSCSSNCIMAVTATWINNPTIRSYDVMGVRLSNVSLIGTVTTKAVTNSGTNYASNTQTFSNGFGASTLLPSGSSVRVYQTFITTMGGKVYASYQHAMENTTLATSKKYTISSTGYGGVLSFYGSAVGVYDAMNGVDISV